MNQKYMLLYLHLLTRQARQTSVPQESFFLIFPADNKQQDVGQSLTPAVSKYVHTFCCKLMQTPTANQIQTSNWTCNLHLFCQIAV